MNQKLKDLDISTVFFKDTKRYPKQNSIIKVNSDVIVGHLKDLSYQRTEEDVQKYGMIFCYYTKSHNKLNWKNTIMLKNNFLGDYTPLVVEDVYVNKKPWVICNIRGGFFVPEDIRDKTRIHLKADDVTVVDIKLCDGEGVYSYEKPDFEDYCGFFDKNISNELNQNIYQNFKVKNYGEYFENQLKKDIVNCGVKELSYVFPKKNPKGNSKEPPKKPKNENLKKLLEDISKQSDSLTTKNKLSNYTKRMFSCLMENIPKEKYNEEFVNDVYFEMKEVMENTYIDEDGDVIMTKEDLNLSDKVDRDY